MRFKFLQNKDNYIWLILVLALSLRLGAFFSFQPWDPVTQNEVVLRFDAAQYHSLAVSLTEGDYRGNAFWAPGFPFFASLVYQIFGPKPWAVLLLNCFIGLISVFLLERMGTKFLGRRVGLLAALLMAIEPHQIMYSQMFYTENLFIPILLASAFSLLLYVEKVKISDLILSAFFLALCVYIRPAANYIVVVWAGFLLFHFGKKWKEGVRAAAVLLGVLLLVLSPWLIRNYMLYGYFGHTTNGGFNVAYIFASSIYENQYGMTKDSSLAILQDRVQKSGKDLSNPFILDQVETEVGWQVIKSHPKEYLINHFFGSTNIYFSLSTNLLAEILHIKDQLLVQPKGSPAYNHIDEFLERKATPLVVAGAFILLSMAMTYLFVLRGILVMYKDGQKEILFFLLLTILYFTLIIGPLGGSVRFKVPITPFYLIIAAVGMIKSFPRISLWSKRMKA
ncbi:MAG: glycosyltransferase family 39 protein [Bacteroidetes bacterium]|nr:glycosyltransferase family 39 protein [Bacteroidota bacterium]